MTSTTEVQLATAAAERLSMRDPAKTWIAILGAGASCAEFLANMVPRLMDRKNDSVGFIIIDPKNPDEDGKGIAWTHHQSDRHFANMHLPTIGTTIPKIEAQYERTTMEAHADLQLFRQRVDIGTKLHQRFRQIFELANQEGIKIERVVATATNVEKYQRGYKIYLEIEDGESAGWHYCDYVVFALGHFSSTLYQEFRDQKNFIQIPWKWDSIRPPKDANTVGILGTGPTCIDVVSVLRENGYKGRIEAFSRSGMLQYPRPKYKPHELSIFTENNIQAIARVAGKLTAEHVQALVIGEFENAGCNFSEINQVVQAIGEGPRKALAHGILHADSFSNWFSVLKAFDSVTAITWNLLSDEGKLYYKSKIRRYHTAISYGMVNKQAVRVHEEICDGSFVCFGGLANVISASPGYRAILNGGDTQQDRYVDYMINCTGIGSDLNELRHPLIENLLKGNIIQPHPDGGAICDFSSGRIISPDESKHKIFTMVGSLNYGTRLLTHCYGEVELSAARVTDAILNELEGGSMI